MSVSKRKTNSTKNSKKRPNTNSDHPSDRTQRNHRHFIDEDEVDDETRTETPTEYSRDSDEERYPNQTIMHSTAEKANRDYLDTFQLLTRTIPRDQNGFCIYLLDHQMIPPDYNARSLNQQKALLVAAQIPLNNLEGYPAFDFSKPIWNQLNHEPESYYTAFRAYLLSAARDLTEAQEALPPGFTPFTLKEAYILFFWQERARAYDLLKPVAAARLKDQRLMLMEDNHYLLSTDLLKSLTGEIDSRSKEDEEHRPWKGLAAVDLFKSVIASAELQRSALGLPVKGPKINATGYAPAPHASIDRNIRDGHANYIGEANVTMTQAQKMRQELDRALAENPEQAAALQEAAMEIILKTRDNSAHAQSADPANPHDQSRPLNTD
jgi:hypothetical protein